MKTALLTASTLGLALAACGDNHGVPALDASEPPIDAPSAPSRAVIVAGDFTPGHPGVLSTLDPITGVIKTNVGPAMAVGDDPILRHFGHELFIVNRGENNVTILDDQTLALVEQLGTGASSNPQDVAVVGNKLYVATLGSKGLTVLTRGSTATAELDLSADDPGDGKPDCNSVYLVGTELYVSCGLLHNFVPSAAGIVHVIDTATDTVKATMTLAHKNPLGLFERIPSTAPHGGDLLITTVENYQTAPGCIERVTTGATPAAAGCLIDNAMLGGFASRIDPQVAPDIAIVWAAVAHTDFVHADLRAFDMSLEALWAGPLNASTEVIADVAHCPSGELIIADSAVAANGLRIYNGPLETTKAALPIGLGSFSQHGLVCY